MKPKKLVFGVGLNNAGYVVKKFEELGYVDGKRKLELAHELAAIQTDPRVTKALIARYSNYTRTS